MDIFLLEWLNLVLRWLHVITAIAWIGASFYFIWLDNSLETPPQWKADKGVSGDLWSFHGGGIYEVGKYTLAPPTMPKTLHWFKWEAYSTWITGTLLLIALYYVQADLYLVNKSSGANGEAWVQSSDLAIVASVIFLAAGLAIYELLIRSPVVKNGYVFIAAMFIFILVASYVSSRLFSPRASFLHLGAMLATIMAANVFIGIIPAQKGFVKSIENGDTPDLAPMLFAKTRSVHNNYFTLPVLFTMISNHYSFIYSHSWSWLALVVIIFTTAYARHFFNLRHKGIIKPHILIVSVLVVMALAGAMAWQQQRSASSVAATPKEDTAIDSRDDSAALLALAQRHCSGCHAKHPTQAGFSAPPAGLVFENIAQLRVQKSRVAQSVSSHYMPLGNMTGMSDQDRALFLNLLSSH